jgi:two-component system alkaline phosphatase synthesis response regulator PhoP
MSEEIAVGNKILLVEDEESLAIGLKFNLTEEGYTVDWVIDGRQAVERYFSTDYDLVILDIMLPYLDGYQVAEQIRGKDPQIPILILTARTGALDRIKGLEIGADDYLTKPFHLMELLLRVKGMLKRKTWYQKATNEKPIYKFGDNQINFENLACRSGKSTFQLTAREAMVMRYLIENKGKIISRDELLEKVWSISSEIETRTVDNFILRLRKYFEPDPANPTLIKSIRGAGYIFDDRD